jgi:hypothetical protein
MAQIINVCKVTESGELIQNSNINFASVVDFVTESKERMAQYPWLSSVDEYGNTTLNRLQSSHVIDELNRLSDEVNDNVAEVCIRDSVGFLKTQDVHEYIKFIGD